MHLFNYSNKHRYKQGASEASPLLVPACACACAEQGESEASPPACHYIKIIVYLCVRTYVCYGRSAETI